MWNICIFSNRIFKYTTSIPYGWLKSTLRIPCWRRRREAMCNVYYDLLSASVHIRNSCKSVCALRKIAYNHPCKALKQCTNFVIQRLFAILSRLKYYGYYYCCYCYDYCCYYGYYWELGVVRLIPFISGTASLCLLPISLVWHISAKTDIIMFVLRNWNSALCHLTRFTSYPSYLRNA